MQTSVSQLTLLGVAAGITLIATPLILWLVPPPHFTTATVAINRGTTVSQAADRLAEAGVIYTPELVTIPLLASSDTIVAGTYQFDRSMSATAVVDRLLSGQFGVEQTQVVIPEGFTNEQIADRLADKLSSEHFSPDSFLLQAAPHEGYLYPDTYQLHANMTADEVISLMRENFADRTAPLTEEIAAFGQPLSAVVKMASLVEREAAEYEIRRRIAGVLWRRLEEGMPLQVDAVFAPLLGKSTYELTMADLQTDSPYNLHINTGLPPTPIANPGISAIKASIRPTEGEEMYYLSDRDGNFYFAETLSQHNRNRRRYLDAGGV